MNIQIFTKFIPASSLLASLLILALSNQSSIASDYPPKGDFTKGSRTWAENCNRCHNIRSANELRDDQWITTVFHMRVRAGLTGQETRDILTFLMASNSPAKYQSKSRNKKSSTSKLSGKEVYNQTCVACHGADGKGTFPAVPNFTDKAGRLAQSDEILIKHITDGFQSPGSAMAMPAKGGNPDLTSKNVKDTLKYMRSQFGS